MKDYRHAKFFFFFFDIMYVYSELDNLWIY